MTIQDTTRKAGPFTGNGAATTFPFTFKVFAKSDLALTLTDANGTVRALTLDSDYSITLNANQETAPGGSITYPITGAPLSSVERLIGIGDLPYTQPTDITNQGGFYPEIIEDMSDRSTIQIQQLAELGTRTLHFPVTEDNLTGEFPSAGARAGTVFGFDQLGNPTYLPIPASVGAGDMRFDVFIADTLPNPLGLPTFTAGVTTVLPLSRAPINKANCWVYWDGTPQLDFTIPGTSLTFPAAIWVGVSYVYARTGTTLSLNVPAQGSVTDDSVSPTSHVSVTSLFVTPEMFGAIPDWNGTSGTDNTVAFALLNSYLAAKGGGRVYMVGRYYLPTGWALPCGNILIDGFGVAEIHGIGQTYPGNLSASGFSNIIVKNLISSVPVTNLRSQPYQINVLFINCNFVTFDNVRTNYGVAGIWAYTCNDVTVTRCTVNTPKADGVHFGQGSARCEAIECTVISPGDDAFATTYDADLGPRPSDIVFANNIVTGAGIWGAGVAVYDADNVTITGNNIRNTGLAGINLGANGGAGSTNVVVSGNKIYGASLCEKQPNSYWFGTDPSLDPVVTANSFKSGIFLEGTNISFRDNLVSNVSSYPNGLVRIGMTINGGAKIAIGDNSFVDVNGVGIDTGIANVNALTISGNTFDYVHYTQILARCPMTTTLSITNNTTGFGSFVDYAVKLQNAGAIRAVITNNTSSIGKGISTDGTSTNVLNIGNYS